jgi:starch phosphorylase
VTTVTNEPEVMTQLRELSSNLRWSWDQSVPRLMELILPKVWARTGNPHLVVMLLERKPKLQAQLCQEPGFVAALDQAMASLRDYLEGNLWYQNHERFPQEMLVGYFSMEFGLAKVVPIYSGGLGILAGDHLKSASDLGVPMVAVGLMYKEGYFRQMLEWGWQKEAYDKWDPRSLGFELLEGQICVDLAGETVYVQIWRVMVGRTPLLLLDTDFDANPDHLRKITDRLYSKGPEPALPSREREHRIRQELVLAVGGHRALRLHRYAPTVFHINEGHAGFLGFERIRELVNAYEEQGRPLSFYDAADVVRRNTIFTTHTPVPAGIDRFGWDLVERYLLRYASGLTLEELKEFGRDPNPKEDCLNMAVIGLRLSDRANGVSKLNGEQARKMFAMVSDAAPITSITNGVHPQTWTPKEWQEVFEECVGPEWWQASSQQWKGILNLDSQKVWDLRNLHSRRLVEFVRSYMHTVYWSMGYRDIEWMKHVLDPDVLSIVFARRGATYKQMDLLIQHAREQLEELLLSGRAQFVFAGLADPADNDGKAMIQRVHEFCLDTRWRHRIVFLPRYNMEVAKFLVQGADLWLNNPLRPYEACGTSGMKAAYAGALNLSELDGWWDECSDGINGFDIGEGVNDQDPAVTAALVMKAIKKQILPRFENRNEAGLPPMWVNKIRLSMASLGPLVGAPRMAKDYVLELYIPAHEAGMEILELAA